MFQRPLKYPFASKTTAVVTPAVATDVILVAVRLAAMAAWYPPVAVDVAVAADSSVVAAAATRLRCTTRTSRVLS